jgi:hypothetical protein
VRSGDRVLVAALFLIAVLAAVLLLAFAGNACPATTANTACPQAGTNRVIVVGLASVGLAFLVSPFAFLAEFIVRRRIAYRGAWGRAARRGTLAGLALAAIAGLRLGGALTVPVAIFVVILAVLLEWLAARRFDGP